MLSSRPSANRWVLFAVCAAAYFFAHFHRVSSAVIASDLQAQFNTTSSALGVLSSTYFWAYAGLQLPIGMATDRYSPRLIMTLGMALATIGSLIFGVSSSLGVAVVARTLAGAGAAAIYIPALKILGRAFGGASFPTVTGFLIAAGNFGSLSASSPYAVLVAAIGWRWSFAVIGCVSAVMAVASWAFLRGPWDAPERLSGSTQVGNAADTESRRRLGLFLALGIAMFVKYGPLMGYQGLWGVPYLTQVYEMTKVQAGNLLMWISIGYIVGGPGVGLLSDRYGLSLRSLFICTSLLYLVSWIPLAFMVGTATRTLLCMAALLMGITGSASGVIAYALCARHSGAGREGGGLGIVNGCSLLGGAVFQPLMGFMIDKFTTAGLTAAAAYTRTFQAVFVVVIGMVLISLFISEPAVESSVKSSNMSSATEEANRIGV